VGGVAIPSLSYVKLNIPTFLKCARWSSDLLKSNDKEVTSTLLPPTPPHTLTSEGRAGVEGFVPCSLLLCNVVPNEVNSVHYMQPLLCTRGLWMMGYVFSRSLPSNCLPLVMPHHHHVTDTCYLKKGHLATQKGQIHLSRVMTIGCHIIIYHLSLPSHLSMSSRVHIFIESHYLKLKIFLNYWRVRIISIYQWKLSQIAMQPNNFHVHLNKLLANKVHSKMGYSTNNQVIMSLAHF